MYVKTIEEEKINRRWNTPYTRKRNLFVCDECGKEYNLYYKKSQINNSLTFCSKECRRQSRINGKLLQKNKDLCMKRYGVEFFSQVPGAAEKMIETRIERYGTNAPIHFHDEISEKWKNTMQEKYGVDHHFKSEIVHAKRKETLLSKYGVENALCASSPFRPSGEEFAMYGQMGYKAIVSRDNTRMLSKPEIDLGNFLFEHFGKNNVERQCSVFYNEKKRWLIDFYIKTIDTYLELDGIFWHGLDCDYELLHPKAKSAYDNDRKKDCWFRNSNKKLVRITDKEFVECQKKNDFSFVIKKLGG